MHHVGYLTDALEEYGTTDGYEALGLAQQTAKIDVANIVLEELQK